MRRKDIRAMLKKIQSNLKSKNWVCNIVLEYFKMMLAIALIAVALVLIYGASYDPGTRLWFGYVISCLFVAVLLFIVIKYWEYRSVAKAIRSVGGSIVGVIAAHIIVSSFTASGYDLLNDVAVAICRNFGVSSEMIAYIAGLLMYFATVALMLQILVSFVRGFSRQT